MWLGFDLGTQSVRAVVVSESGRVMAECARPISSRRSGARHEQDPNTWWKAVAQASRTVVAAVPGAGIAGLAVDGTSGTILLCDNRGNAITPTLMYDDSRATVEAERVNETGEQVWQKFGYCMQPSWALPKLVWLLHEYRSCAKSAQLVHQVDFINRRLAGCDVPSDASNATKTGYDLIDEGWPFPVFEALGIPSSMLPCVVRPGTAIGTVCHGAASETGIPAGTPIVAGMTDGCAAQIAAGVLNPGSWSSVLGTTLVLKGVSAELVRDPDRVVYSHRSPDGKWLPGGASNSGAGVLAQLFAGKDLDALGEQAAVREPTQAICYPLRRSGERFPFATAEARGFTVGEVGDEVGKFAAVLQGVSFLERLCFDRMDMLGMPLGGHIVLTGGGARNRYWRQLRADVLGSSVSLPEVAEPAFGMALLAGSQGKSLAETAKQMVRIREVIDPKTSRSAVFHDLYLKFIDELWRRGWLGARLAAHARARAKAT